MDVIRYCKLDLSDNFPDAKTAREKLAQFPTIQVVSQKDNDDVFIVEAYLDIMEFNKLVRKGEPVPQSLVCPTSGYNGVVDKAYLTYNTSRLNSMETVIDMISKVELFHKKFDHPISQNPRALSKEEVEFRYKLLREELEEFKDAPDGDMVEQFDAMLDLLYITYGTLLQMGMKYHVGRGFNEVQRSNMSKLGADGKPVKREDGKIMKSELYFKPDLNRALRITANEQKED